MPLLPENRYKFQSEDAIKQHAVEQFNGREGETATFIRRCPLNFSGLGGGFAPRHLSCSVFL
jgi:hypothetical protein